MRSQAELLARADELQRQLTDPSQHLSPYDVFAIAEQLAALAWMLGRPLDQATPRAAEASDVPNEAEAVDEQVTLLTSPRLRHFGHSRLLMLGLPPVHDARFEQEAQALVIRRDHAEMLSLLRLPDPWQGGDPNASARVPVLARKSAS